MTRVYAYCLWSEIIAAFLAGWKFAGELPGHHGHWSVCIEWSGKGDPVDWRLPPGVASGRLDDA